MSLGIGIACTELTTVVFDPHAMQQTLGLKNGTDMNLNGSHLSSIIRAYRPDLSIYEDFYRGAHQDPEISGLEARTASVVASHLLRLGFVIHSNIGTHGVVGVLKNGPGKTILIRAELDALPILEQTNLPYKSTKRMIDRYGNERPIMHACGHDMNMAALLAASALLKSAREEWSGTLITLFQPDEEETGGAKAMINDGLYSKIPVPDIMLGQHVVSLKTAQIAIRPGPVLVAADAMNVRIIGGPCPGVNPQNCVDPIPIAMRIVMQLQDVVTKKVGPGEFATVACWGFHAGIPGNDYVAYADFLLDIKTFKPKIRSQVLSVIRTTIELECKASNTPQDPIINNSVRAPLTSNTPSIVEPISRTFSAHFASDLVEMEMTSACEDFSTLGALHNVPYAYWNFGGSPGTGGAEVPNNHSLFRTSD